MPANFRAIGLAGAKRVVKIVTHQLHLHPRAPKQSSLANFLFRCGHWHKNYAFFLQMPANIGDALRVIAGAGTDEHVFIRLFAHGIKCAAQFIGAHRR